MTQNKPLYQALTTALDARRRCEDMNTTEWFDKWNDYIDQIMETAPSGSGIDDGTKFDDANSTENKLVFTLGYHHMNEVGMYDGWTEHTVTIRPSLQFGFTLSISGRNRNGIKDYLHEVYHYWISGNAPIPEWQAVIA